MDLSLAKLVKIDKPGLSRDGGSQGQWLLTSDDGLTMGRWGHLVTSDPGHVTSFPGPQAIIMGQKWSQDTFITQFHLFEFLA